MLEGIEKMKNEEKRMKREEVRKFVTANKLKIIKEAKQIETAIRSHKSK